MTKKELILEATDPAFRSDLTAKKLNGLSPSTIERLSPRVIDGLSPRVINGLSLDTIERLSPRVIDGLSLDTIARLSPRVIEKIKTLREKSKWEKPYTNLLAAINQPGHKLRQATWHTCETTHCIAGWTVVKAPHGKELEARIGTGHAARLILSVSRPDAPLPRFDSEVSEEAIMAFIEARADEEK
jgi:hypothetical protein